MSVLTLNVDEVMRTLSAESSNPFVVHDKEVDIVRFAINSGFADIVLDGQVALRVMYQRPGETEVRAQTLTYYDTDGLHNYYDWQLSQSDLAKNGSLMVALCILDISGGEVSEWHTTPCAVRVLSTIHTDDSDEGDDTITPTVKERVAVLESMIQRVASGAPIVVTSVSAMTDTDRIYVLSTDGKWYYHNGTAWTAGGEYGAVSTDTTLTQSGIPADAKAVGDVLSAMNTATSEDVGKALKAKTVADGKVTEWEFGETRGSNNEYVTNIKKNLIDKDACVLGSFNQSTGEVIPWNNRYVTDFIPIVPNVDVYRSSATWGWVCYYTESKEFISGERTDIAGCITIDNAAYVRLQITGAQFETAQFSLAKYYNAQTDENGYVKTLLNDTANEILADSYNVYAEADTEKFIKTENLFDYYSDTYFIKGQVNPDTGVYAYHTWDSDVPDSDNAYIGIVDYYPVSYGQVLFCNYGHWAGAYYDANKAYLGKIPEANANVGWVVPDGCAYVRLNIKGSKAVPTPSDRIGNISEMKNLMIYTKNANQTRMPVVAWKPNYQLDGKYIAPNYLDTVIPSMTDSPFISAMKCMIIREMNAREHAWRFGNFNTWVTVGMAGWDLIQKMLMDFGIDFCGFEECAKGTETSPQSIAKFLQSWQFADGFMTNWTDGVEAIDKSLVSRYRVISSTKFFTTSSGSSVSGLNCKIQLPRYNDVHNPKRTLSVYVVHLPITSDAHKVSVANEIIAIMAQDTSDFIVVAGDTNDFADTAEGKLYWRTFEAAGYRPMLPMSSKTVTQDILDEPEDDPSKMWRHHAIDQFLVSSNISMLNYGVVNTKDAYGLRAGGKATDNEPALSDHDFVWADLVFDYDTPRDNMPVINETEETGG